jgi:hypothetical protein
MSRPSTPASAPARINVKPGEDALSAVLSNGADVNSAAKRILEILETSPEPIDLFSLAKSASTHFSYVSEAVHDLVETGQAVVVGDPGSERVRLK